MSRFSGGNAERLDLLMALGLSRARLVVITYNDPERSSAHYPNDSGKSLPGADLVRTRDDSGIDALETRRRATEVVPERWKPAPCWFPAGTDPDEGTGCL